MEVLIFAPKDNFNDILAKIIDKKEFKTTFVKTEKDFFKKMNDSNYNIVVFDTKAFENYELQLYEIVELKKDSYLIALITSEDKFSVSEALRIGIDDYTFKELPYSAIMSKLSSVSRWLNKFIIKENSYILTTDNLVLNVTNRVVKRGERNINLTNKEFLILEHLLRNKNNIVTRENLLDKYWDMSPEDTSNIVDVYINFIRKKIQSEGEEDIIKTVRGVGYIIQEGN